MIFWCLKVESRTAVCGWTWLSVSTYTHTINLGYGNGRDYPSTPLACATASFQWIHVLQYRHALYTTYEADILENVYWKQPFSVVVAVFLDIPFRLVTGLASGRKACYRAYELWAQLQRRPLMFLSYTNFWRSLVHHISILYVSAVTLEWALRHEV